MSGGDKKCCVPDCGKGNVVLHGFPNPDTDADRFRSWIYAIGGGILALDDQKIFKCRRVCRSHFETKYHTRNMRLSIIAVPTLHLPASSSGLSTQVSQLDEPNPVENLLHSQYQPYGNYCSETKLHSAPDHDYYARKEHQDHTYFKSSVKDTPLELLPGPSRPKTSDEACKTIKVSDKSVGTLPPKTSDESRRPIMLSNKSTGTLPPKTSDEPPRPVMFANKSTVSAAKENSHLHFIRNTKSTAMVQYFSKAENKYDLTEESFLTPSEIKKHLEDETCSIDYDHEMDITEHDVEDLGFNDLHLEVTQVLDADDKWGELRLDCLSTTVDQRVLENENTSLSCDKSSINAPADDDCDFKTLKEININGEIVKKIKKVDDDVFLVSDDDNNDAVTSINSEDFREDGVGEHNVPQEHQGFCCNVCLGKIVGFRYRCCECVDYDICSDCEYRGEHPLHYVLRVPGYRKPCEVRRVMAAVHLALAPPTDVKDELTIKIEDPEEAPPPDPLDTEEAAPRDPELMEDESTPTPLTGTDLTPPPAKVPKVEPSKRSEVLLKLVRTPKTAIPVALDALKRKAIVRLNKLHLPLQENPAQTESLDEDAQRKQITNTYSARVTKKETIENALEYTRDSSQSTLQNIDHIIPIKHSTQHFQSKSKVKSIDLLQTTRKSQQVIIIPQNITVGSENIFVAEQTDDAIAEANTGENIFVEELPEDLIVGENIFVMEQNHDAAVVEANTGENIFVVEQNHDVIVEANAEEVFHMTQEEFNALISTGKFSHNIAVQESPGDKTLLIYPPTKSKTIYD